MTEFKYIFCPWESLTMVKSTKKLNFSDIFILDDHLYYY